ncbi:hypothetical protein BDZ85DRAFT_192526 [Elsinoe ampelina]|uniref:Iron-sulfur cluster assembly factor IBA57 homolog, mitochondrial n=1 Tax=Elsinoe ampelina TaxID=302913 RepID=A0A6A6GJJ2_9PEZI|nr:hypothetical protein BDZ85DRAFT_192526 [Elsinoe ampelina]
MPPRPATRLIANRSQYVCASCRNKRTQRAAFSTTSAREANPPPPPTSGYAHLNNRSLIHVSGADAPKFLHGLITTSVHPLPTSAPPPSTPGSVAAISQGFYSAFLTAQGRVINEVFVYPVVGSSWEALIGGGATNGFVIELDSAEKDGLLKHLKRHKLRSKVKLRGIEDGEVSTLALWREGEERWTSYGLNGKSGSGTGGDQDHSIGLVDQRAPGLGKRVLLSGDNWKGAPELEGLDEASLDQYNIRRYLRGVPEGQNEIQRDQALPMGSNLDVMGAIDFKKGCYVGQELTIRTHHTGVVRRRVLPVLLYDKASEPPQRLQYDPSWSLGSPNSEEDFKIDGKRGKPGRWIAGVGNVGLAMCRLEQMTDLTVTSEPSTFDETDKFVVKAGSGEDLVGVKAFVPDWIRGRIRAPKQQKRVE